MTPRFLQHVCCSRPWWGWPCRLALLTVALWLAADWAWGASVGYGPLLAQFGVDDFSSNGSSSGGLARYLQWQSLPLRITVTVALVLMAHILCFWLIFPAFLRKRKPLWPRTAFGIAAALFLLCLAAAVIFIMGDYLAIGHRTFADKYGIRVAIAVAAVFFAVVVGLVYRSSHAPAAPR